MLTHCVEPTLGIDAPIFIYDYPATQAALAKIQNGNPDTAERFELYFKGTEDVRFIAALHHGLPSCAGVALGIDRLVMLACKKKALSDVISFGWHIS